MENTISLYEVYNTILSLSQEKDNIYKDYAKKLTKDLELETILFKKVNLAKKEISLYIKNYEDIGDYFSWQELSITQKENAFIWKSTNKELKINIFNATNHLTQLFNKLFAIKDYITMQPLKLIDTTKSCNIQISQESLKIRQASGSMVVIPLEFQKNVNAENKVQMENLLQSIYLKQSDIPKWLLNKYTQSNAINVDNIIKKLKIGFEKFMS